MSLIHDLSQLQDAVSCMADKAKQQQMIYRRLIDELVAWRMECRLQARADYVTADRIRRLLRDVGIVITNGVSPNHPNPGNRQVSDTWELKQ